MKKILFLIVMLVSSTFHAQQINVSTGVTSTGQPVSQNSMDPNWNIISGPSGFIPQQAFVVPTYTFNWQSTPITGTNAQWVNNVLNYISIPGDYVYERSFNIDSGTTSLNCNFGIAYDDTLISLELISPTGFVTALPVIFVNPGDNYQISPLITNLINNPTPGIWKIRAKLNYFDSVGGFMLSGYINYNLPLGVTNVQNSQCGITLPSYSSIVYANLVPNAQMYRFKVTNLATNQVVVQDYVLRNLYMSSLSNFEYNQTYSVEVAVKRNNLWEPYGLSCNITTPTAITKIRSSQCGVTLINRNTNIAADLIPQAQGYRFKVTNTTTNSVQNIDKVLRVFNFNEVVDYMDNTIYQIEVAVKNTNGSYLSFGPLCTLTSPFSFRINQNDTVLTAFPNPFNDNFKLYYNFDDNQEITISIFDMFGKEVEHKVLNSYELESFSFGSNLLKGIYNVIINSNGVNKSIRMVKQ